MNQTNTSSPKALLKRMGRLDKHHTCLQALGISQKTIEYFSFGYCQQGEMQGRIVVPIHGETSLGKIKILGYIGFSPESQPINRDIKYIFLRPYNHSNLVFNLHRAANIATSRAIGIVKDVMDVVKLFDNGYRNTIALMGRTMSDSQGAAIQSKIEINSRVLVIYSKLDSKKANFAKVTRRIGKFAYVKEYTYLTTSNSTNRMSREQVDALI